MKYLVIKSETSIDFFPFNEAGDSLVIHSERSNASYYVRQISEQIGGLITVNVVNNYAKGGTFFQMTHSGCNMRVDDQLIPQGVLEMEMGKKYVAASKITLFLINEEDKSDVQSEFNNEQEEKNPHYYYDDDDDDDIDYDNYFGQTIDSDDGYDDQIPYTNEWEN